jgi:hypothetical protein
MGITQVTVAVRNPANPDTAREGRFLVDTGAVDCPVPAQHPRAIGIQPRGKRQRLKRWPSVRLKRASPRS